MKLPATLYWQCRKLFLKCAQFEEYRRLSDFCNPQEELYFLVEDIVQEKTRGALVESCLNLLTQADESGDILLIFVKALQDSCHSGRTLWSELNDLYAQIKAHQEKYHLCQPSIYSYNENRIFKSILEIDFDEQQDEVTKAIELQKSLKRTAAFLIHGEEKFGQETLVHRLSQLSELRNGRRIKIKMTGMGEVSDLWNAVATSLTGSKQVRNLSLDEVMPLISECLQSQHLIFIFTEVHRTCIGFLPELIEHFWRPMVDIVNLKETYLVMFLVDNKGKVCKSGMPLAWQICQQEYPKVPLHLPPTNRFLQKKLYQWLRMAIAAEVVPESLSVETLLQESQGGVPELVYQRICHYCGCSWEGGLAKWLIQ
ncbi:MAG: hypothetical protein F6K41_03210 [Symploca sp. SIO3E6]|nr:hypothetical protein [Caldora sp. SIO3E6]